MAAIDHIAFLADEIGPRGSTSEAEAEAAKFAAKVLARCDLEPEVNGFKSARSNWHLYALFSAIMLLALALFLIGGRIASMLALTFGAISLASALLDFADAVATDNRELGAHRHKCAGAFTEGAIGGKHGMRVLTFIAVRPDGSIPNWHRPSDLLERIDESAIARCDVFLRELLLRIDNA